MALDMIHYIVDAVGYVIRTLPLVCSVAKLPIISLERYSQSNKVGQSVLRDFHSVAGHFQLGMLVNLGQSVDQISVILLLLLLRIRR